MTIRPLGSPFVFFVTTAALLVCSGCHAPSTTSSSTAAVALPHPASVTLSWSPPQTNANGSTLTDLAGYRIHFGTSSTSLTSQIDVTNPGVADYVVDNLQPGTTYYFAVSSYNSAGVESAYSQIVSVTI